MSGCLHPGRLEAAGMNRVLDIAGRRSASEASYRICQNVYLETAISSIFRIRVLVSQIMEHFVSDRSGPKIRAFINPAAAQKMLVKVKLKVSGMSETLQRIIPINAYAIIVSVSQPSGQALLRRYVATVNKDFRKRRGF